MKQPEPADSASQVAELTEHLAAAERLLAEREGTIRELRAALEQQHQAGERGAVPGGAEENAALQEEVAYKDTELRWKTAFLQAQVDSSIDGLLVVNDRGKMILQNRRFVELLKIPQHIVEEIDDTNRLKWVTEMVKHRQEFVERVGYLYAHRDETGRDEIELKDGTVLDRYSSPVVGPDGTYYGRIWAFRDITERKRAEEELRDSEERFAGAFEYAPIGVALVSPEGHWLKVNRAVCELVGYSETELLALTFQDITHPDDLEVDLDNLRQVIAGEIHSYQIEKRYIHKLGHLVTVLLSVSMVRDGQGEPRYFISQIQDITEQRLDEEQLRESKRFAESIAENSTSVIYVYDLETHSTVYSNRNAAESLGYTQQQIMEMGDILPKIVHPEDFPRMVKHLAQVAEAPDGEVVDFEFRLRHASGNWHWSWARDTVFKRRPNGEAWQIMGTAQDITERKQAEAELELTHKQLVEASRLAGMTEVATSVLHNVGNVLNSVNISAGLVVEGVLKSKAASLEKVAALLKEHEHDLGDFITSDPKGKQLPAYLAQLSEHLLTEQQKTIEEMELLLKNIEHIKVIVTMQQGYAKVSGAQEITTLADLVEDSLRMNGEALERHHVRVVRDYDDVPPLSVDRHKVVQILVNLIRNAKHACQKSPREDRRITFRIAKTEGGVSIAVIDNGAGIPAENLTRIFSHGFTTSKTGHGFGLHSGAISARQMGGSLTVHSDGPGQGATFTLELPSANG